MEEGLAPGPNFNRAVKDLVYKDLLTYKVSGVMCSASACEHGWSVEGWIHSQRRNRLDQKLVEKLSFVYTQTWC